MWAWRRAKIPAPLPLKAAGLPQVGGGACMLNQMQSFSYSLGLDVLIYSESLNSSVQTSSLSLFAFISAFNLPTFSLRSSLFSKALMKSHGNAYQCDFFQTLPWSYSLSRSIVCLASLQRTVLLNVLHMKIDIYFLTLWDVLFLNGRLLCSKHQAVIQRPSPFRYGSKHHPEPPGSFLHGVC